MKPTQDYRCDRCCKIHRLEDLNTVDIQEYGEHNTLEVCDDCMIPPKKVTLSMKDFEDTISFDLEVEVENE